eukprot:499162_1
MATGDYFMDSLIESVDTFRSVNQLSKLLHLIPFVNIQSFIKQQIKVFNPYQTKKAYYMMTSINDVFPCDILQHILSFTESKDINSIFGPICKAWKQFAEKNEENYI